MAEFVARTTAPETSNRYYYADNIFYTSGYGLPNCTCYAWGRFYELSGTRPKLSTGNAENWWAYNDGYARGSTPKLGAVICWRRGQAGNESDGAGHVAIVEKINSNGTIVTSNSAYNSTLFYQQTLSPPNYSFSTAYTFQGFIYNPVDFGGLTLTGNSPLVTHTRISPNRTSPRNHAIDTITIHCTAGEGTAQTFLNLSHFVNYSSTNGASCNYCIGYDGSVGLCVEEKDRSWCSSNSANDHRAITIEVSSKSYHPYEVTETAFNKLIDLLVDICNRNNITRLLWKADKSLIGQVDKQNMTVHRWFSNKACPGDYLYNKHYEIAELVNARLDTSDARIIWNYLIGRIGNPYGVAGIMGNLQAESNLCSYRLQGDFTDGYTTSKDYTAKVDNGTISKNDFVHNGPNGGGYGLAQWTFYTLKQGLYEMWKSGDYTSIGDLELHLDFLWETLNTSEFSGVLNVLKNATSIREASDKFLHDFERPADQSESVEIARANMGQNWYDKYANMPYDPSLENGNWVPNRPENGRKRRMSLPLLLATMKRKGVR